MSAKLEPIRAAKGPTVADGALRFVAWLCAIAVLLVGCFVIAATSPMPPSPTSDVPPAAPAGREAKPDRPFPGDRTLTVGDEVAPGTYASAGAVEPGVTCYWARLRGAPGSVDSTILDGASTGPQTVTIESHDQAFASRGCAEWRPA